MFDFGGGMVSGESPERRRSPAHETLPPTQSVAQFCAERSVNGRAVLAWTRYRWAAQEPLVWVCCIRNKFREVSYWLCHHSKPHIRQIDGEVTMGELRTLTMRLWGRGDE